MAYTPREIKDRVAIGDDIFILEDLGNNRIRLIPAPTHVLEPGTPVNKALLQPIEDELANLSATKVDKVPGKGLSTNDFTNALKNKLDGIEAGAQVNAVTSVAGRTGAVILTKSDVGLSSVQNYGIATQAQAQAGTANNVYMTPLRVKEAISALAPVRIAEGSYIGNAPHEEEGEITINVGFTPKIVIVMRPRSYFSDTYTNRPVIALTDAVGQTAPVGGIQIVTNGFVAKSTSNILSDNWNYLGHTYRYFAIA